MQVSEISSRLENCDSRYNMITNEGKTKSFTPEQKVEVDKVLSNLLRHIEVTLKSESERIKLLDNRPRQVWSEEQPDVFFYYVRQGMLEDLIVELQARV